MPFALRKLEYKILWNQPPTPEEEKWLGVGELRADALVDIATEDNSLSLYIFDDQSAVTLDRILGAVGATRNVVAKLDFAVFDVTLVEGIEITKVARPGKTPDAAVNAVHLDLMHLTATKLAALGNEIQRHAKIDRRQPKDMGRLINKHIKAGYIDSSIVDPTLLERLKEEKYAVR